MTSLMNVPSAATEVRTRPKIINIYQEDGEERSDGELSSSQFTTTETDATLSPTIRYIKNVW